MPYKQQTNISGIYESDNGMAEGRMAAAFRATRRRKPVTSATYAWHAARDGKLFVIRQYFLRAGLRHDSCWRRGGWRRTLACGRRDSRKCQHGALLLTLLL